jgi:cytochrome P450
MVQAGAETTSSFLSNLVLILAAYPEVAKKAREEIDRVVGGDRLPQLDDYQNLPYLQAVVSEVRTSMKPCARKFKLSLAI